MITTEDKVINGVFFGNGTASHFWRIDGVANRMNQRTPHAMYVTTWQKWNNKLPEGTNLVILEMLASPDIVKTCHDQGAKVIWEADDAMLDSYGDERKNLQKVAGQHKNITIQVLNEVDAITVTTQILKDNYARFTDKPIYVLPNYVDYDLYGEDELLIKRTTDEIRIGWFGSQGHLEDLKDVVPALKIVLEKYPNVKFVYCGFGGMSSDKKITEIGWGEDVFKELPREKREFYIGVREDYWPVKHRTLDFDIGICPLIDDEFNWCKSHIKWMEYGVLGIPAVVSPVLYKDYVTDGENALIARNTDEWVKHLSALIEDKELRNRIGKSAQETVKREHNLEDHWETFLDVFNEVV